MSLRRIAMLIGVTLLLAIAIPGAYADNSPYDLGEQAFTTSLQPTLLPVCTGLCIKVTYMNNLNFIETGIVYTVIHNSSGQTVSMRTATITPAPGQEATATFSLDGLPSGTYNATVFVVTPGGGAISTASTIGFTTIR